MLPRTAKSAFAAVSRRARSSQNKPVASNVSKTNFASGFAAKVQQKFEILKNVPAANFLSGLSVEQRSVAESQIKSETKQSKTGTAVTALISLAGVDLMAWWLIALLGDDGV
eukprot:TRINITY_DN2495_c0_g1_i2.p1 TRINITY_DN2495_c0_g1~~TRINITY_DN2495_c0_g1_i2.p1  ORF type:complete len:112 (+),score=18.43 TRINITY_DN2495_c0_g1_i2:51-386(+)